MSEIDRLVNVARGSTLLVKPSDLSIPGNSYNDDTWQHIVRAILTALREPSDEMLYECSNIPNPEYGRIIMMQKNLRAVWQAMIDHILNQDEGLGHHGPKGRDRA